MAETVQPGKLYAAVEQGDLEAVKEILVHATADDVNYQATNEVYIFTESELRAALNTLTVQHFFRLNQRTALAKAAILGNCEILQEILKHPGLDPNLPNKVSHISKIYAVADAVNNLHHSILCPMHP